MNILSDCKLGNSIYTKYTIIGISLLCDCIPPITTIGDYMNTYNILGIFLIYLFFIIGITKLSLIIGYSFSESLKDGFILGSIMFVIVLFASLIAFLTIYK